MNRSTGAAFLAIAALAAVLGLAPAFGADGDARPKDRLSISPPRTVTTVEAGERYTGHVTFRNYTRASFNARIATRDLTGADDPASFAWVKPGLPKHAGTWIEPSVRRRAVEPGDEVTIPFTVEVPDDAAPGVHAAAILVSRTITTPGVSTDNAARVAVTASVASQFVFTVRGELHPAAELRSLEGPRVVWPGDEPRFEALLANTGNTLITANPRVGIGAFAGRAAQTLTTPELQALPDTRRVISATWEDRPLFGWFRPTLFVDAGGGLQLERSYPLVLVLPPWWVLAALAGAVALPLLVWWRRRQRRTPRR